jgi:hypothetical protein
VLEINKSFGRGVWSHRSCRSKVSGSRRLCESSRCSTSVRNISPRDHRTLLA